MVVCAGFRNPALTAKMASTIDVISGGRFELAIGAGWKEEEWRAYGYGFPTLAERMGALGDQLEIIRAMFGPGRATYEGRFAHVRGAIDVPKGIQSHIPIIVGGNGARVTAGYAIRYADELNYVFLPADEIAERMVSVRARCEAEGRDPAIAPLLALHARRGDARRGPGPGRHTGRVRGDRARSDRLLPDALVSDARGTGVLRRGLPRGGADAGLTRMDRAIRQGARLCPGGDLQVNEFGRDPRVVREMGRAVAVGQRSGISGVFAPSEVRSC